MKKFSTTFRLVVCYCCTVFVIAVLTAPEHTANGQALKKTKEENAKTSKQEGPKDKRVWYQLVNITIPADSPLRKLSSIDKPPQLCLVLKKNGKKIGTTSHDTGWSVDFPSKINNQFPIRENSDARYTLEVWDWNRWSGHQMIFNVTQIKGEEFRDKIYEVGGTFKEKSRLAYFIWKQIETPEKYQESEE